MHFLLSSMSVVYVLTTPMPEDGGENPTVEQVRRRAKRDNDDYVCRGLILNVICTSEGPSRAQDNDKPKGNNVVGPSVVNMVAHNNSSKYNDKKEPMDQAQMDQRMVLQTLLKVKVDSGATVHVCEDRCWFKNYESLNDGSILHMGNESTALVH
ncbi:hypothetical protein Tco_0561371 [Tanacetum coccineum]